MKRILATSTLLLLLGMSAIAWSALEGAAQTVKTTTENVLARVQADRDALRADPAKMYGLVSEMIFPHFDFGVMSQWVLGQYWAEADDTVREAFVDQFRKLLVRTYATALLEFSNQSITYPPVDQTAGEHTAMVKQEISQPGAESIPISYRLHNKSGAWKVFDISVDGISLVKTYRASFSSMIRNNGLDGLIESLNAKNALYNR